uniref:Methyltransferase domain-containing protein n=1 Tax=Panagrolaimus davidi TaxID=227884 RepID=A0A914QNZ2_9BILA
MKAHSTNSFELDRRILELRNKKVVEQREMLKKGDKYKELYNILTPEAFCPNLIRLGRSGDGGKWICNPFVLMNLEHPCIFYSFGLNNEVSFEQELLNITKNKCKHIAVDADKQQLSTLNALQTSIVLQAKILTKTKNSTTDKSFIDILKHFNTNYIDLLKIDIEGWEHTIIDQLLSVPICQILIEIHDVHQGFTKPVVMKPHQNVYNFLHFASLKGFYLIHFEVNYRTLGASEFTLLHKNFKFKNTQFYYKIETGNAECENKMLLIAIPSRPTDFKRRMELRGSWLKNITSKITYRFFIGYTADVVVKKSCLYEAEVYNDMIITDLFDSYATLMYKTYVLLNWQQTFCKQVKYTLKIDDDTILNVPRLMYWIKKEFDKEYAAANGKIIFGTTLEAVNLKTNFSIKWNPNQKGIEYCQGFTYLVSSIAAKLILPMTSREEFIKAEDVMFTGLLAEHAGVQRSHKPKHFTKAINPETPIKTDCGCDENEVPYLTSVYIHTQMNFKNFSKQLEDFDCEESKNISRIQFFASCFA